MTRRGVQVAVACLLAGGCHEQVVGTFSSGATSTSDTGTTGGAPSPSGGSTADGSTGGQPFVGCFVDDFDDDAIDRDLWNPFADGGALIEESAGALQLIPAPTGLAYSGVSLGFAYRFRADGSWVRFQLASGLESPRPVNIYAQLGDDDVGNYTLRIRPDGVDLLSPGADGQNVVEEFPAFARYRWFGLREEGGSIVFEASEDDVTWQTIGARPLVTAIERTKLVLMAETAGDNADQTPIAIERVEACAE